MSEPAMAWREQAAALWQRARRAKLFRDAFWVLLFSVAARAMMFFGSAHAARCLGPVNMGISGQVQVLTQQLGLAYNGGFDPVAVREIARDPRQARATLTTVLAFRLGTAVLLAAGWLAVYGSGRDAGALRVAWMTGAGLLVTASLNTAFLYQGLHRLPLFTAIGSCGSALAAMVYLLTFVPGMPVGSDLIVNLATGILASTAAVAAALWLTRGPDGQSSAHSSDSHPLRHLAVLARQGWRYWLLAGLVYLYAGFPLLMIAHFRDDHAAGVFRVAFMMAGAIELLFGSINSLLVARQVEWCKEGLDVMWSRQRQLLRAHLVIGVATGMAAIAIAPWFFAEFLGPRYAESVHIFQVLVAGRVIVFVAQIYAFGLVALHLDTQFLWATFAGAVVSLALNLALVPRLGATAAALASVASEAVVGMACYHFERRHILEHAPG